MDYLDWSQRYEAARAHYREVRFDTPIAFDDIIGPDENSHTPEALRLYFVNFRFTRYAVMASTQLEAWKIVQFYAPRINGDPRSPGECWFD